MIILPPWLFGMLILLGFIFVFSGFEQNRLFMGSVGGTILMILGILTYESGIPILSGAKITTNESETTVTYIYEPVNTDVTQTLSALFMLIGLYGIAMPLIDRISGGVKGRW